MQQQVRRPLISDPVSRFGWRAFLEMRVLLQQFPSMICAVQELAAPLSVVRLAWGDGVSHGQVLLIITWSEAQHVETSCGPHV